MADNLTPLPLRDTIRQHVLIFFDAAAARFRAHAGKEGWLELEDAIAALQGLPTLDSLQLTKLFGETPARLMCKQIAAWVDEDLPEELP